MQKLSEDIAKIEMGRFQSKILELQNDPKLLCQKDPQEPNLVRAIDHFSLNENEDLNELKQRLDEEIRCNMYFKITLFILVILSSTLGLHELMLLGLF